MKLSSSEFAIGLLIGLLVGGALGFYFAPRGSFPTARITTAGSTTFTIGWHSHYMLTGRRRFR